MAGISKTLLLVVVVIVAVAVVGAAVYFFVLKDNGSDDSGGDNIEEAKYWYYIDYGSNSTTETSGWMSALAENSTPSEALVEVLDSANIENDISGNWIISIGGVEPVYAATFESWYTWVWTGSEWSGDQTLGLDEPNTSIFYLGITTFDEDNDYAADYDPNSGTAWKNSGPFA